MMSTFPRVCAQKAKSTTININRRFIRTSFGQKHQVTSQSLPSTTKASIPVNYQSQIRLGSGLASVYTLSNLLFSSTSSQAVPPPTPQPQTVHPQTDELLKPARPIPPRNDADFRFQTPVSTISPLEREPLYRNHTQLPTTTKKQVLGPGAPLEDHEWSPQMVDFTKKIWKNGFEHEVRKFNPYLFLQWDGASRGGLEMEVFHKPLPGHPTNPEELGTLLEDLIPPTSVISNHPALPIPDPETGLPVAASSIAICHAGPYTNGPPGRVHGGLIASIFDVIAYRNVEMVNRKTVTANLNINYKSSIPVGHEFVTVTSVRLTGERKALCNMAMFNVEMNQLYAEATGIFVTPKEWVGKTSFDYHAETKQ